MAEKQWIPKELIHGNSTIVIHSSLAQLTKEYQKVWFERELGQENPTFQGIIRSAMACLEKK